MQEKLIDKIDKQELVGILNKLISIPGHLNIPGQESEIGRYILSIFKSEKIDTTLQEVEDGRSNVISSIKGTWPGMSLALNGHIDTVPPNDSMKEYEPVIRDGKVFGLGAADMKGSLAAMIYSMIILKRSGIKLNGSAFFTGVIGEETGGTGTRYLLQNGFNADFIIVGEPTDLKVVNSHKGCYQLDIVIKGKAAHASIPEKGVNAISAMCEFIALINKEYLPVLKERKQGSIGSPTLSIGMIRGGKKVNIVADKCTVTLDRRWIDSEQLPDLKNEIEHYLKKVCENIEGINYEIIPGLPDGCYFGPFFLRSDHKYIKILKRVYDSLGKKMEISGMQGWTDASTIVYHGIPAVIIGAGSMELAHSECEFVEISEVVEAAKIYLCSILNFCGY